MRTVTRPVVALEGAPSDRTGAPAELRPEAPKRGPGPSRIAYRLARIWKKPRVRRAALALPLAGAALIAFRMAGDPEVRALLAEQRGAIVAALSQRPEFAVRGFRVTGASATLERTIGQMVDLPPRASSLTLDVAAIQARVAELGAVRGVRVKLGSDGVLAIAVDERVAEALWRDGEGVLWLTDRHGFAIGPAGPRADHPALPVAMGQGAQAALAEALALFRAVPDLRPRLRAFVRVGERRWDVVLDRDLRIMLPAEGAEAALARVMALHYGEDLLDRDLAVIDMRLGARPTLRLTPRAMDALRLREAASGPGKET